MRPYLYIFKHGIGPGTIPDDVSVVKVKDLPNYYTAVWLDRFLTTDELRQYDIPDETKINMYLDRIGYCQKNGDVVPCDEIDTWEGYPLNACDKVTASDICYRDRDNDDRVVALDVGMTDEDVEKMLSEHPSYYRSTLDRFEACDKVTASEQSDKLSRYLGANLLMKFSAFLNVYGAEESDEFDFEEAFDGSLGACLDHLVEYQKIIDDNGLDAYLSLEPWNGGRSFEGDLEYILTDLVNEGYITQEGFDHYYYGDFGEDSEVTINASTRPKYFADMISASDDGYEQLAEDEDDYYKYYVVGYFDIQQRGVDNNLQTRYFSEALDFAHDLACNGDFITIKNLITGDFVTYTPDEWMEAIELGDVPSSVYTIRS